ncbi:MAG: vitamin B12 dependent-methionine synthase activation domain-containing protein [Ruminococcus sp.]
MITLRRLNRDEAVRYLGGAGIALNEKMNRLLEDCERELLSVIDAKFLYRVIDLPFDAIVKGRDIRGHLGGCDRAAVMCATLGAAADRLLRVSQITDMSRAVVLDSLASAAVEQVCGEVDALLAERFPGTFMTFRFSPGYGDYPLDMQRTILRLLDAPRKIGLTLNESLLLTPSKSVTAVIGLSDHPIPRGRRGCAVCSLRETCAYRRKGSHCGFENTASE